MLVLTSDPQGSRKRLDAGLIAGMLGTGVFTTATATAFRDATKGAKYGAILAADEEGGLVQRYRAVAGRIPSASDQARSYTPAQVQTMFARHGRRLAKWGVTMALAPVVDVGRGPGIGSRSYSSDPAKVVKYAGAAAQGYRDAGLLPVAKHFPGHGRSSADSHLGRSVGPPIDEVRAIDLMPYEQLLGQGPWGVMVGHTTIPGYSDQPSSSSKKTITGLLRGDLDFNGLVISDALAMTGSGQSNQGDALVAFLRAGGDLGIVGPGGAVEGRTAMRAAIKSGDLSQSRLNASAARVLAVKGVDACKFSAGGSVDPVPEVSAAPDAPIVNPTLEP